VQKAGLQKRLDEMKSLDEMQLPLRLVKVLVQGGCCGKSLRPSSLPGGEAK